MKHGLGFRSFNAIFVSLDFDKGCCRYAEGIPPSEVNPELGIDESNGARCWYYQDATRLVEGDPTTAGLLFGGGEEEPIDEAEAPTDEEDPAFEPATSGSGMDSLEVGKTCES